MVGSNYRSLLDYAYFDKVLRLENVKLDIVSIIVLYIEARQYNIKINLAISCSPRFAVKSGAKETMKNRGKKEAGLLKWQRTLARRAC